MVAKRKLHAVSCGMAPESRNIRLVQDLRQALEELDEALDRIEDQVAARSVNVAAANLNLANFNIITPRSPYEINRTEMVRMLDATIVDAQKMLGEAA